MGYFWPLVAQMIPTMPQAMARALRMYGKHRTMDTMPRMRAAMEQFLPFGFMFEIASIGLEIGRLHPYPSIKFHVVQGRG